MKIIITDNFKDSVAKFIVGSGITLFFLLLFGIVGGIENGTLLVEDSTGIESVEHSNEIIDKSIHRGVETENGI